MAIVYLDSSEDRRLEPYRGLSGRPARGDGKRFIVEGRFLVERLLASTLTTESILTDAARVPTLPREIDEQTTVFVLPSDTIDQLVGFDFHRGMLACGLRCPLPAIDECVPAALTSMLMVVCSQVSDPANLGGILRNCAAFGATVVLLGPGCADPFSRRALRVSMGAVFKLAIATSPSLAADLRRQTDLHNVTLVATVLDEDAGLLSSGTNRANWSGDWKRGLRLVRRDRQHLPAKGIDSTSVRRRLAQCRRRQRDRSVSFFATHLNSLQKVVHRVDRRRIAAE